MNYQGQPAPAMFSGGFQDWLKQNRLNPSPSSNNPMGPSPSSNNQMPNVFDRINTLGRQWGQPGMSSQQNLTPDPPQMDAMQKYGSSTGPVNPGMGAQAGGHPRLREALMSRFGGRFG